MTRRSMFAKLFSALAAMFTAPLLFGRDSVVTLKKVAGIDSGWMGGPSPHTSDTILTKSNIREQVEKIKQKYDPEAEAFKKYYDETEINAKPVWLGESGKFAPWNKNKEA